VLHPERALVLIWWNLILVGELGVHGNHVARLGASLRMPGNRGLVDQVVCLSDIIRHTCLTDPFYRVIHLLPPFMERQPSLLELSRILLVHLCRDGNPIGRPKTLHAHAFLLCLECASYNTISSLESQLQEL
jgi:hypothetical protein